MTPPPAGPSGPASVPWLVVFLSISVVFGVLVVVVLLGVLFGGHGLGCIPSVTCSGG